MEKLKDHWVLSFVGLLSGLVGMYPVIKNLAPDPVDRPAATKYLHEFFRTAVHDPSKAYGEFDNPSGTRSEFVENFSRISNVHVAHVQAKDGGFTATVTFDHRAGWSKTRYQWYELACSKWSELPFLGCGDISIRDVTNSPSGTYG